MARQPRTQRPGGARAARRRTAALAFDALAVEGSLIASAQLAKVAARDAGQQAEADYGVLRGLTLRDEIARYFRIGQALFAELAAAEPASHPAAIRFTEALLRDVLGFSDLVLKPHCEHEGRVHPVTLSGLSGRVPVLVVPMADALDRPSNALLAEGRRASAALALQDWLNASDGALWGLACNGERLRLVRDNPSLTRPAYIEADLRRIFEGEVFADFTALWLLLHASRFGSRSVDGKLAPPSDCALEHWRDAGQKAGLAARDRLRDGVEQALQALGDGFVRHGANAELRRRLAHGERPLPDFHGCLLRLVYRMIFLLVAEDRGLLHPPEAAQASRTLYAEGYGLSRLRDRAVKRSTWDGHDDLWDGLLIVFERLGNRGEPTLGLPALAGLFEPGGLGELETAALPNRALMEAIFRLAWLRDQGALVPVNWRDMETEELGSVYESLLELTPRLTEDGRGYTFAEGSETRGNQRKTTGSYYTPDSLVQVLLDGTLNPVLDGVQREAESPAEALLGVTVIDPACGSGHFLLAAARRIATRVARARAGGTASAHDYRHALRQVARSCIHGVDRNPMAVELTKVALWIETVEPGKPLGFLDANIRCGDALLGVFDLQVLAKGVPDAAYKALAGDDKDACRALLRKNKAEREGQGTLDFTGGGGRLPPAAPLARAETAWRALPEDSAEEIAAKRARYDQARADPRAWALFVACDLYTAAFLAPKPVGADANLTSTVASTADVWRRMAGGPVETVREAAAVAFSREARAFHWPLEFPELMARGGFDVVIGNPPWERIKLQEQEFFAQREPEIAGALNAAARGRMIATLAAAAPSSRNRALYDSFEQAKRTAEASSTFARVPGGEGGRFALTGRGDVNTYALFAELFANVVNSHGRAGIIAPTGLATDLSTSDFFGYISGEGRLVRLISFENEEFLFSEVHNATKFAIFILGPRRSGDASASYTFLLRNPGQLSDPRRTFELTRHDLVRLNPNTGTAAVLRSQADADLAKAIHDRFPILWPNSKSESDNAWRLSFFTMFHMAADSALFVDRPLGLNGNGKLWFSGGDSEPFTALYEGKMFHHYNHRAGSYRDFTFHEGKQVKELPAPSIEEYNDPNFDVQPRYYVPDVLRRERTPAEALTRNWLLGWRDITGSTVYRTTVAAILPAIAVGHTTPVMNSALDAKYSAVLVGLLSSMVFDYLVRLKIGGLHLTYSYIRQIPAPPPNAYTAVDLDFIVPRVLELTFTSWSLQPFALDLGYHGPPFGWNQDRRARLRAELDAWYARAYGLKRDEMRFILDPADLLGADYPSETFRVLQASEIREFGEYRSQRLVLESWDEQEAARTAPPAIDLAVLPDNIWARPPPTDLRAQTRAQIAAVLQALGGPCQVRLARLAASYALEPRLLTARLAGAELAEWRRLVGPEADPGKIESLGLGGAAGWGEALRQLSYGQVLIDDFSAGTWAPGPGLSNYEVVGWVGRAAFALACARRFFADKSATLTAEEHRGVEALAA